MTVVVSPILPVLPLGLQVVGIAARVPDRCGHLGVGAVAAIGYAAVRNREPTR